MEVFAKYLDPDPNNWSSGLTDFMTAVAGGTAPEGTVVDGGSGGSIGGGTFPFAGMFDRSTEDETAPKAYLNFIVFDRDFNPIIEESGFMRITTASKENGDNVPHDTLKRDGLVIKEAGYLYIYLSNENETEIEVYFDDFKVEHIKSPVVQMDDYYPFGLTFNSYRRENSTENRYLYNQGSGEKRFNTERIFDLGLNIDLTKYRAYDPAMGRWWQVDPLADLGDLVSLTPYNYAFNNPIRYNDPYGDCIICPAIPWILEGIVALAEGATVAAGGTAIAVGVTGLVENAPSGAHPAGAYSPGVGFAMSSSKPGEISSPYFLNSKSKTDGPPNPNGAKGKPDHQEKVKELEKKAQGEANEGETVLTEKKIQNENSNRRPDVQIVDKDGKTRKVMEAERKPNSQRNIKREEEYKKLGIEQETHKVGGAPTNVPQ